MTGAVPSGANFEPLPWVLSFEETGLVLAHNSLASAQRIIKPNDPHTTGLMRFLGTDQALYASGVLEKLPVAPASSSRSLPYRRPPRVFTLRCAALQGCVFARDRLLTPDFRPAETLPHSYPG